MFFYKKNTHSYLLDLPWSCPHLAGLLCIAGDHMLRLHVPTRQLVQLGLRKQARQVLQRAIGGEAALARLNMWAQLHVRMWARPEAIGVRGGVGGGAAEGVFLRFFETGFKISGRTKRRGEIADFRPAGRNARRAGRFVLK